MTKKHADAVKRAEITERRRKVAALYLAGNIQTEIASELGVDQATISRDLTALQKLWSEQALRDLGEAKAEQLAKIDKLEREYWEAWVKSQNEQKDPGDPRFLDGVQWCVEQRCKVLGLNSPLEVKGNLGVTLLNKWKQQAEKQMDQVKDLEDEEAA